MKRIPILLILLMFQTVMHAQKKQRKVVFVIADGIPADVIEKVAKPHMDQIIQKGFYKRAFVGGIRGTYNQTPTISAPGYNNLLTGTWSNKHQVLDNAIKNPNYHYWSIFRYLKEQRPEARTAVFSSWLDNRIKLIGDGLPQTGGFKVDIAFDGYELDTLHFPHDRKKQYSHLIDEWVVNKADSSIRASGPDLSWVYLEYTDDMGHAHGDSPEFIQAVQYLDDQMGRLAKAIDFRQNNFNEEWMLVITTDHGRDQKTGMNHGGQSDRERTTWIISNIPSLNEYGKRQDLAIVDILPSIASFLQIRIPVANRSELDGVSFIGPVSIANAKADILQNQVRISWTALEKKGTISISYTNTQHFKTGAKDRYRKITTVAIEKEQLILPIQNLKGDDWRILLSGKHNSINTEISLQKGNGR